MYQPYLDEMLEQVFTKVWVTDDNDSLIFENEKAQYVFSHRRDCCESVYVDEVIGDLSDLENLPLLVSRLDTNQEGPKLNEESYTWTFYSFATFKGYVTVRFLGSSNGYYSEEVDIWKNNLLI